jgi:hypothetical protein
MNKLIWALWIFALVCIVVTALLTHPKVPKQPQLEQAQSVIVRVAADRAIVVEYENGDAKVFDVVCGRTLPVWVGEKVNLIFHWTPKNSWNYNGECYTLDKVVHIKYE